MNTSIKIAVILVLLTLLAACGGQSAVEEAAAPAAESEPAEEAAASADGCEEGFRLFEHVEGETCIPENPQRIVAPMDDETATPLLDLGAPVIATGVRQIEGGEPFIRGAVVIFGPDAPETEGLIDVGNPNQPNLETIFQADPDLIILNTDHGDLWQQAEEIAPTIVAPETDFFLDYVKWLADAAGVSGTYADRLAAYQARVEEVSAKIEDPASITVSQLEIWETGTWYDPNFGALDQVITDLGLGRPAVLAEALETGVSHDGRSAELITDLDGDIILSSYAGAFGQSPAEFEAAWDEAVPFWRELSGVASGNHHWFERDLWNGRTFTSLNASLDGLEAILLDPNLDVVQE